MAIIPKAVDAVRKGALDFLQKPLQPNELLTLLENYLPIRKQQIEQRTSLAKSTAQHLLGESPLIVKIREQAAEIALTTRDALIEGEQGAGRHTVARLLHQNSQLSAGPYVTASGQAIHCTADLQRSMISARSGSLCLENPQDMPMKAQQWLSLVPAGAGAPGKKEVRVLAVIEGSPEARVEQDKLLPETVLFPQPGPFQPSFAQATQLRYYAAVPPFPEAELPEAQQSRTSG